MEAENIVLKKKVKQLQNQICQRTRNYLYHFKKSPQKAPVALAETQSQTDEIKLQNAQFSVKKQQTQNQQNTFDNLSMSTKQPNIFRQVTPTKQKTRQFKTLNENQSQQQQQTQLKTKKNTFSLTSQKQIDCDKLKVDMQKFYNKEYRKLRKQIKKLREHLQYEIQISTYTKEGLLISQQQNYKFRLQIQDLKRQLKNINESCGSELDKKSVSQRSNNSIQKSQQTKQELNKYRNQNEKYQEMITHLQTVKSQYLSKCIKSKQEIFHMKDQNLKLKLQIGQLKKALIKQHEQHRKKSSANSNSNSNSKENAQSQQKFKLQNWVQLFKSKAYQISNCLPIRQEEQHQHSQANAIIFKPETIEQLLNMLERILNFCKEVQNWENKQLKAVQKERSNLLTVLSTILVNIPSSKNILANTISQIDSLSHLVNFINRRSNVDENQMNLNRIDQNYEHQTGQFLPDEVK